MDKWDETRHYVNNFNLEDEISKVDIKKIQDVNQVIKDIKKFGIAVSFGSFGVYNINRAIFTPRENARQKGSIEGMTSAFSESMKMLKDSIHYGWEPEIIRKELEKSITKNYEALELAKMELDDRKPKKIYKEMFYTSKINHLIQVWDMLFYPKEQQAEIYLKRKTTN